MKLFGRKRDEDGPPPEEVYTGLRRQVLGLTAEQLGDAYADAPVLALLMETGYPKAVVSLVAVADGATSLYFSNGGGIIGAGAHAAVAEANRRWLAAGGAVAPKLPAIVEPPPPPEAITQFVAVTPDGLRGVRVPENELGEGKHPLSPFFYAAQDVITQIRLTQGG